MDGQAAAEGVEPVGIALDGEVKPPSSGDPGPPEVTRLVVLLGSQGGVVEILEEELEIAVNRALDGGGNALLARLYRARST